MLWDISWTLEESTPHFKGDPPFFLEHIWDCAKGNDSTVSRLSLCTHWGTHIDLPRHFFSEGADCAAFPLERLCGPAKVLFLPQENEISAEYLKNLSLQKGDRLLFKTKNTLLKQTEDLSHIVTLTPEAAGYLAKKQINLVGIDHVSIEPKDSRDYAVHKTLLGAGIPIIETLFLKDVEPGEYRLYCLPLKIKDGEACPVRAILER